MKSAILRASLLVFCSLGLAVPAGAQSLTDAGDSAVLLDRGAGDLLADLGDSTHLDRDIADTVLVFNNRTGRRAGVWCAAYDADGNILGRADTYVPGNGLRYLRASDLSGGVDFVGSAVCKARGRLEGSVVFLAPSAITSLKVRQHERRGVTHFRFPLVASY